MTITRIKTLLQLVAAAHIFGGLLLPFLVAGPLFAKYNELTARALGFESGSTAGVTFLISIFGPTVASWGILFFYAISTAFRDHDSRAWWILLVSILVWAPYEALLSIWARVYLNALIDFASAAAILIPLLLARRYFFLESTAAREHVAR